MSAIPYSFAVIFDPAGSTTGPTDITKRVERLEVTDIGSGEIRSAKIRLNAQFGGFVTNTNSFGDGAFSTPLLDEYDKVRITIQDKNTNTLDAVYEVDNLKPLQNTQQGTILEVELLGLERHLQRVHFSKPFFFESAFEVSKDIVDFYNDDESKGSLQATVNEGNASFPTGGNELPKTTGNEYDFDVSENYVYDGLISVVDRMGSSVAAGGGGDFFELNFENQFGGDFNTILFRGFISGNPPSQQVNPPTDKTFDPTKAVTITDTQSINPGEEEGGIEATVGTVTATWGGDNFGSVPIEFSEFNSALEAFQLSTLHIPGELFKRDSIVQNGTKNGIDNDNTHFQAINDTTQTPPDTDWLEITFVDFLSIFSISDIYSPFTKLQNLSWKNSGSNPAGSIASGNIATDSAIDFDAAGCFDSNLVITDFDISRTSVEVRAISTGSVPSEYFYGGTTIGQYRGFRILVDTEGGTLALGVPFNQNGGLDQFGNSYADSIVQNNGAGFTGAEEFKNWTVFALPRADTATSAPVQREVQYVGVDNEGRVFQFVESPPSTFTWTDVSGDTSQRINDCYHPYQGLTFDQGYNNKDNEVGGNFGFNSAVRYTWISRISDSGQSDNRFYKVGAWACFKFPFPTNTFNFTPSTRDIGDLYGDGQAGFPKREPATVDTNNMHFTHDGQIGFNNLAAEDLGPIDALIFYTRFRYKQDLGDNDDTLFLIGDMPIRATFYDISDNVVTQDFVIPFNNQWTKISLPMANFKIYRARKPTIFGPITDAFLQQLEVLNVFEWKNFKKVAFQWMRTYDDNGRYSPIIKTILSGIQEFFTGSGQGVSPGRVDWFFDGFNFEKPLLSVSPPDSDRSLQPRFFHEPFITNKFQLDQSNLAKTEITRFRHKQYEVVTEGIIDIDFGQSFFLLNTELVREADRPPGDANTIKLVAKKIRYVIDKTPAGPGGFLRYITGVKRFE